MPDIMSVVVSALRADQSRLEQSSLNAVNASTPGYRRSSIVSLAFEREMTAHAVTASGSIEGSPTWAPTPAALQKITDFSQGSLQKTGRTLDVAIEGKGFLSLTDGTHTWLTRTAALQIDAHGDLVGPNGLRVVGADGDIRPGGAQDLTINASGQLMRNEQILGRIKVVAPTDEAQLSSDDGVLFQVSADHVHDASSDESVIRSGFLEASNTSSLKEMMTVMESVRHFESLIRIAQGYDDVMGKAIQKLGEV